MTIKEIIQYTSKLDVLYVEDDLDLREQTIFFLQKLFHSVESAENGEEGIEKYKSKEFDIVITDIAMPRKDGIEMIKEIYQINKDQSIVVTSGYDDSKYLIQLINMGIDGFHIKPYERKDFLFSLYKSTRAILFEKQKAIYDEKIKKKTDELNQVMNSVDTGIFLVDHGNALHANNAALKMTFTNDLIQVQDRFDNLSKYLIETADYVYGKDIYELIEKTKDSSYNKVMMKLPSGVRHFLFSCLTIDEEKYVISFSDITAIENAELYNQVTGLANEKFLANELDEYLSSTDEMILFVIKIKNYEGIIKWHGRSSGIEAEKKVADTLQNEFYRLDFPDKGFLANVGINRFVIISKSKHLKTIQGIVNSLRDQSLIRNDSNSERYREFSLDPKYKTIQFSKAQTTALLETFNREFDAME